tara:strand:+ start:191 stop:481 length:291 start_codon:yes stop_codon:yes gene_type:complete
MMTESLGMPVPNVTVVTTESRGHTPEEFADMTVDKIISIGDKVNPVIQQQALAYKEQIRSTLIEAFSRAMISERTTLYNLFAKQGHEDMAKIIKGL